MKSVILVEDDPQMQKLLADFFELQGVCVQKFYNPENALEKFMEDHLLVDCVISDIQMPHMDGFTLVKKLNHMKPEVPCILMTAFANEQTENKALQAGAFAFLEKPFALEQLQTIIKLAKQHKDIK